jgi:hypothetical protein
MDPQTEISLMKIRHYFERMDPVPSNEVKQAVNEIEITA